MTVAVKPKKCRQCKGDFIPRNSLQFACSPGCAIDYSRDTTAKAHKATEKRQRAEMRKRREALKSKGDWLREAQTAFNSFIRARDHGKPCISCGLMMSNRGLTTGSRIDAGHYRSRGSAGHLRFNTDNCHAQCSRCNRELSGNITEYRRFLLLKIGIARLERLENDYTLRKFDVEYLKRVKRIFNRRARHYKKLRGIAP